MLPPPWSNPPPIPSGQSREVGISPHCELAFAEAQGCPCQPTLCPPTDVVSWTDMCPHAVSPFPREKDGIRKAHEILVRLGMDPTQEDCVATHHICQIVSTRSANLCAATLAAVLRRIKENKGGERLRSTIGVDGSVYKKHPQ